MAVKFKLNIPTDKVLDHLAVNPHLREALKHIGAKIDMFSDGFRIRKEPHEVSMNWSVDTKELLAFPTGHIINTGAAKLFEKAAVSFLFKADKEYLAKMGITLGSDGITPVKMPKFYKEQTGLAPLPIPGDDGEPKGGPLKLSDWLKQNPDHKLVIQEADKMTVKVNIKQVVRLSEATQLYQRVHGTSAGSVYFVVAIGDGINVAARISGNSLSIRAEGQNEVLEKFKGKLMAAGLTKSSEHHYSVHFTCESIPPERALGAVLLGSGIKFNTPLPEISKLK